MTLTDTPTEVIADGKGPSRMPRWDRLALVALLVGTAVLYLWGLGASGWANPYYSAAVQAGATSWKAFFFGSSDAANAITVDKTPAALWPMALAARLFGVNAWSVLVPQALMGVGTVATVYAAVRRRFPAGAALLAGAAMALTPVAALMFRFNNPDALLVLLLTLGAYGLLRAQEDGSTRWLMFAASCVGFGFLAKMLQAFLVVPAFALVYLLLAPGPVRRRVWQLLAAGAAMVVAAGWWVAAVALVPASSRPYVGGSQDNSVLELALGYNGLGRLNGGDFGGLGNTNADAGWDRMFGPVIGGQISWLLPAALLILVAGLWVTRRAPRTDPTRAGLLLWGGWLLVTAGIFSFMQGIFHEYYTVALAPPIAALTGMGAALLWSRSRRPVLAAVVAVTAVWAYVLLGRTPDWFPLLRPAVLVAGLVGAVLLVVAGRLPRAAVTVAAVVAVAAGFAGPAAYAVDTAGTPHTGAIVTAGPATGFGPGFGPGGRGGQFRMRGGQGGPPQGAMQAPGGWRPPAQFQGPPPNARMGGGRGGGPGGGLLNSASPGARVTAALKADAASYTWVAAAVGSNNASGLQLAVREPVMAIGGFNGTDPSPTLAQFQSYVAAGKIHYFVGGGGMGGGGRSQGGSQESQQIAQWVAANFTATTVDGVTLYDLT